MFKNRATREIAETHTREIATSITETAQTILDHAVTEIIAQRDRHAEQAEHWRGVMEDAKSRMVYHDAIYNAYAEAIKPLANLPEAMEFEIDVSEITEDSSVGSGEPSVTVSIDAIAGSGGTVPEANVSDGLISRRKNEHLPVRQKR